MSPTPPTLEQRASGVLLHVTSLPGPACCGDLGSGARRFADFLARAGQSWWQVLPTNPIDEYNSPYASVSAFAGEPLLIDLGQLVDDGLLDAEEAKSPASCMPSDRADYETAKKHRRACRLKAFERFRERGDQTSQVYRRFQEEHRSWLEHHILFRAISNHFGTNQWTEWPDVRLRDRDEAALAEARQRFEGEVAYQEFLQFEFYRQWDGLKQYCRERGIGLIGDIPIYVALASADVWVNRDLFQLDAEGNPTYVAGVPGDAFNPDGQRWNSPLYDWDAMRETGFRWWLDRLGHVLWMFEAVRLDHFIGYHNYYRLPADLHSPEPGQWMPAPGRELLATAGQRLGKLPFIAEDLGAVSEEVAALRDEFHLPGMNVLQFAFDYKHDNVMERWKANSLVCTGTHDTETIVGWYANAERQAYEGGSPLNFGLFRHCVLQGDGPLHWSMIRSVMHSTPNVAITPMQDLLGLDNGARMNAPGVAEGNWLWRLDGSQLNDELADGLRELTRDSGRLRS